jgi:hypothetical protein
MFLTYVGRSYDTRPVVDGSASPRPCFSQTLRQTENQPGWHQEKHHVSMCLLFCNIELQISSMATQIKCPSCSFEFPLEEALSGELKSLIEKEKQELRQQMLDYKKNAEQKIKQVEEEKKAEAQKQELLFQQKLQEELKRKNTELEENIRKTLAADFENQLKVLQQTNKGHEEKLKLAREKELEFLNKLQELKTKEEELELSIKRRLNEEREKLSLEIRDLEKQKLEQLESEYKLRLAEKEKQLEDQKKLAEEMKRKAEQGSMQLQGETQELLLEYVLRESFPFDIVQEVGKGIEGADCILIVRNGSGEECGKIIFESKRTKAWSNTWTDKLKADMRNTQAELAILVSQVFPKDMNCFGERDGVWICSFKEVVALTSALRTVLIRVAETSKKEENKGEKMQLLYSYLTGVEFRQQMESIVEGFVALRTSITRERIQMEKIWKEREKQLDKVLASTSGLYGSIKGIAGASVGNIPLLDASDDDNLLLAD